MTTNALTNCAATATHRFGAIFSDIPQPPIEVPDGSDIPPMQDPNPEIPARLPEDSDVPPAHLPERPDDDPNRAA